MDGNLIIKVGSVSGRLDRFRIQSKGPDQTGSGSATLLKRITNCVAEPEPPGVATFRAAPEPEPTFLGWSRGQKPHFLRRLRLHLLGRSRSRLFWRGAVAGADQSRSEPEPELASGPWPPGARAAQKGAAPQHW